MLRRVGVWAVLTSGLLLLSAGAGAQAIGVAPFERVAAEGQGVPDVASRLAERLGTLGVAKVVGPGDLGAPALAEPASHEVSEWAAQAGVGHVVVGRITRLGNTLSVDARLLDAATGNPVGARLIEEANGPDDLGRLIEALATQVVERSGGSPATPPVAAARPAGREPAAAGPKRRFTSDSPISIRSDELEALDRQGQKKFLFTGNVRAVQDDLVINSDRLEAFYPPGASQPERLVATGHVVLVQSGRTAHCEVATYYRADERLECTGNAELLQECDRVRGEKITFFLNTEVMKVTGAADVKLRPEGSDCATTTASTREEP